MSKSDSFSPAARRAFYFLGLVLDSGAAARARPPAVVLAEVIEAAGWHSRLAMGITASCSNHRQLVAKLMMSI